MSRKFLLVSQEPPATLAPEELQFDELETIHHTKCKPLSILACVSGNGGLIALKVAEMPAKGRLAEFSVKKYGKRKDDRAQVLEKHYLQRHLDLYSNERLGIPVCISPKQRLLAPAFGCGQK